MQLLNSLIYIIIIIMIIIIIIIIIIMTIEPEGPIVNEIL